MVYNVNMGAENWTTIKEAARLFDRHTRTIHRWIDDGKIAVDKSQRPHLVNVGPLLGDKEETPLAISEDMPRTLEALRTAYQQLLGERDFLRERLASLEDSVTDIARQMSESQRQIIDMSQSKRLGVRDRLRRWWLGD